MAGTRTLRDVVHVSARESLEASPRFHPSRSVSDESPRPPTVTTFPPSLARPLGHSTRLVCITPRGRAPKRERPRRSIVLVASRVAREPERSSSLLPARRLRARASPAPPFPSLPFSSKPPRVARGSVAQPLALECFAVAYDLASHAVIGPQGPVLERLPGHGRRGVFLEPPRDGHAFVRVSVPRDHRVADDILRDGAEVFGGALVPLRGGGAYPRHRRERRRARRRRRGRFRRVLPARRIRSRFRRGGGDQRTLPDPRGRVQTVQGLLRGRFGRGEPSGPASGGEPGDPRTREPGVGSRGRRRLRRFVFDSPPRRVIVHHLRSPSLRFPRRRVMVHHLRSPSLRLRRRRG